jgi:hypothetical protein
VYGRVWYGFVGVSVCCVWNSLVWVWRSKCVLCVWNSLVWVCGSECVKEFGVGWWE